MDNMSDFIFPKDYTPPDFPAGMVWLIGAGPGEPGLLTLEALTALQRADYVVYDALVDERILMWGRASTHFEYAGKRGGKQSAKQRDISLRLIDLSRQGKRVVRLKGGDPFVFGRGAEEAQTLVRAGVLIRVSPGISAGIGGLGSAGIPLTHRDVNQVVTFLTGHDQTGLMPSKIDWSSLAKSSPVIVMYMAIKHIACIRDELILGGKPKESAVAIVQNATRKNMRVLETTLENVVEDIAQYNFGAPAIICVGDVVRMRQVIDWASQLAGERPRNLDPLGVYSVCDVS